MIAQDQRDVGAKRFNDSFAFLKIKRDAEAELALVRMGADSSIADPAKQAWLFQRLYPFMAPYKCKDGEYILPMATFNRRLATGYCKYLGFLGEVEAFGINEHVGLDAAHMAWRQGLGRWRGSDRRSGRMPQ